MAEIVALIGETVGEFVEALGRAEASQIEAQIEAVKELAKDGDRLAALEKFVSFNVPADLVVAGGMRLNGSLSMSTERERKTTVGGGVEFGPVKIIADYVSGINQDTASNLSYEIELVRASQTESVDDIGVRLASLKSYLGL